MDETTLIIEENQTIWGTDRQPAGCPQCMRVFLVPSDQIGSQCPFCRQGHLTSQSARIRPGEPEKYLPFLVTHARLLTIYKNFVSGVWIKPQDLTPEKLLERTKPVFWPLWLVDSDIKGQWRMEAGFDYQVESTKEYFQDGRWISRKQVEGRIRWEPRLGEIAARVDNVAAPALEDHRNRIRMAGDYPMENMQDVDLADLGQVPVECPDLPPEDAWPLAKPLIDRAAGKICQEAAGAQHQQNFAIQVEYPRKNWTQFLMPVYTTYYLDDEGQPQILMINAQTGAIQGPRLASRKRGLQIAGILAAAAGALLFLALIGLLLTMVFPPAGIIGALLGILGFGVGISAIIPAVWPGQWNRKQQETPRLAQKGGSP